MKTSPDKISRMQPKENKRVKQNRGEGREKGDVVEIGGPRAKKASGWPARDVNSVCGWTSNKVANVRLNRITWSCRHPFGERHLVFFNRED